MMKGTIQLVSSVCHLGCFWSPADMCASILPFQKKNKGRRYNSIHSQTTTKSSFSPDADNCDGLRCPPSPLSGGSLPFHEAMLEWCFGRLALICKRRGDTICDCESQEQDARKRSLIIWLAAFPLHAISTASSSLKSTVTPPLSNLTPQAS